MGTESDRGFHVLFFPLMAHGHMLPTLDMARLFTARGARATIITTPHNAPLFRNSLQSDDAGSRIGLRTIEFPTREVGLPEGLENLDMVTTQDVQQKFFRAISMLSPPLEALVRELAPDALVADLFFPFANDVAAGHGIPRLAFHGTSFFSMCADESVKRHRPHEKVSSEDEPFRLPGLPDEITMTRSQLPDELKIRVETDFTRLLKRAYEAVDRCYGMIVNSFYELEPSYADHYRNALGKRAWHIGPVSLCNRSLQEKAQRGGKDAIDGHECLKWLHSRGPGSVVYICFGTTSKFSDEQLREIAAGLEASGQDFIWVVSRDGKEENGNEDEGRDDGWLPDGFEKRMRGKGLIIRGWAPQVLILDHRSVGGFVTHCGWNSVLEGISAGLPMATWPIFAEQFYNEKLVTEVLRIGVGVGARRWARLVGDFVGKEAVERAAKEIMVGERAGEMRGRARSFGAMAKRTVEEGGSSHNDLGDLIEELRTHGSG
ncbi:scopoletin glucosyltransferase-like [Rhodamnia argentea]|uniref:Glycosyltransferase n=1 Tax=Rhodamnia argentea TaxID=178133 RepID=A0A8B8NRL0_9MYRT|nr:scopoletin glucosyltransferase-like [Rhodamnia argentea]XP_048135335.1 scopoletin glucosyltransferase-like [Rhodamnia argentea]